MRRFIIRQILSDGDIYIEEEEISFPDWSLGYYLQKILRVKIGFDGSDNMASRLNSHMEILLTLILSLGDFMNGNGNTNNQVIPFAVYLEMLEKAAVYMSSPVESISIPMLYILHILKVFVKLTTTEVGIIE